MESFMTRNLVAAATAFVLALGFACPAFADDAANMQMMKDMMDNHMAMTKNMEQMMSDLSTMMDAHAKMAKADKDMKANAGAIAAQAKDAKAASEAFKKMSADMAKMKEMKPMDMSKMDPKMKEMMGKMAAEEKQQIELMQKDLDMMQKMMPAEGGMAAPAPATK
jgi:hypothetical protein